jgi:hypothetical protein
VSDDTVQGLAALVLRTKQALSEGGRPDLADKCRASVDEHGSVCLTFSEIVTGKSSPEVLKALSIDPKWMPHAPPTEGAE